MRDGAKVVLKRVQTHTEELPISLFLSSPTMRTDPQNHSISVLQVILIPGDDTTVFIVMPMLQRLQIPPFCCCKEVYDAFATFLEVSYAQTAWFELIRSSSGPIFSAFGGRGASVRRYGF